MELSQMFRKSGFYYRICHATDKILVGPNTFGKVPDFEFETEAEARAFLRGWQCCRAQFDV